MTITRTIGSGGDHADINAWTAWVVANAVSGGSLTDNVVGAVLNTAEVVVTVEQDIAGWDGGVSNFTTTLTAASGQSFIDNASVRSNPLFYDATKGAAIRMTAGNSIVIVATVVDCTISNLQIAKSSNYQPVIGIGHDNVVVENCIIYHTANHGSGVSIGTNGSGATIQNCLIVVGPGSSSDPDVGITVNADTSFVLNNTIISMATNPAAQGIHVAYHLTVIKNNVIIGFATDLAGNGTFSGSNNATDLDGSNLTSLGLTATQASVVAANEFVSATADFRVLKTSTKLKGHGTTVGVPSLDITGTAHGTQPAIGAWQVIRTVTKTIGSAVGRDYATLAAWASGLPADLIADNSEQIGLMYNDTEFSAGAGPSPIATLAGTTDSQHTITLQPAPGQSFSDNPNVTLHALRYDQANGVGIATLDGASTGIEIFTSWVTIKGLQLKVGQAAWNDDTNSPDHVTVENCLIEASEAGAALMTIRNSHSITKNCVFILKHNGTSTLWINLGSSFINNTVVGTAGHTPTALVKGNGTKLNNAFFNVGSTPIDPSATGTIDYNATELSSLDGGGTHNVANLSFASQYINVNDGTEDFRLKKGSLLRAGTTGGSVPTTDIIGTTRLSPPAIGAWELAQPVIKTIGSGLGRDYATPYTWLAALPGSGDLVTDDTSQIGEMYNDSEFLFNNADGSITFAHTFVTDSAHTITLRAAPGQSFTDNANAASNALRYDPANGVAINFTDRLTMQAQCPYVTIKGIQIKSPDTGLNFGAFGTHDDVVDSCLVEVTGLWENPSFDGSNSVVRNSVFINRQGNAGFGIAVLVGVLVYNNTIVCPSDIALAVTGILLRGSTGGSTIVNNAIFGFSTTAIDLGTSPDNTIDYNATDLSAIDGDGTHNLTSLVYASQFENVVDATRDFRTLADSALIGAGIADANSSIVDLLGTARAAPPAIGAWETLGSPIITPTAGGIIINFIG